MFKSFTEIGQTRRAVVRAELIGTDRATAAGITARGAAPLLALCRKLIEAGHDPDRPLHAYRGNVLCLIVRSIGEAAKLTVKTAGNGAPMFAPDDACKGAAAPPIAPNLAAVS
jgi:hypothetical protein